MSATRRRWHTGARARCEQLDLRNTIHEQTAAHGHFGRADLDLAWERTDMDLELRAAAGLGDEELPDAA